MKWDGLMMWDGLSGHRFIYDRCDYSITVHGRTTSFDEWIAEITSFMNGQGGLWFYAGDGEFRFEEESSASIFKLRFG